jgi:dinuclear metal center YbgI/SA1388 family protein
MKRKRFKDFLKNYYGQEFLEKWQKKDEYLANGLQVRGREEVKKIALGVSINRDFLNHALSWGADACIFHHGLSWAFPKNLIPRHLEARLRLIFQNNLNIFGFHGAMDAHPKHGHNALILKKLKAKVLGNIMDEWGWYGKLSSPKKLVAIGKSCRQLFGHEVFVVGKPEAKIKKIAVCSGGGTPNREEIVDLIEKDIDLYISGEIKESRPHIFYESGMAYFSCGHYATEKIGVLELEKNLRKTFPSLKLKFIDIENPL